MIHIVLYRPEKPANTGNIIRTCMCFNLQLHIILPITFDIDEPHLKRAGMDYIKVTDIKFHNNYDEFVQNEKGRYVFFTRYGLESFDKCDFAKTPEGEDIYLIFGRESTGIPKEILQDHLDDAYRLPMVKDARSLNLSNCVAIGAYECLRQTGFDGLSTVEVIKGKDFLIRD